MVPWSDVVWVVSGLCVASAVLAVLHVLSMKVLNERTLHDLRIRVNTLRNQQFQKLRQQKADRAGTGFELVEDSQGGKNEKRRAA
jgi:hypothetical protein